MILDLTDIESFPATVTIIEDPPRIDLNFESFTGLRDIAVKLNVQKTDSEYFCQGQVKAGVEMECARCLGTFVVDLEAPIDFIARAGEEQPASDDVLDDEDYAFFTRNELRADITDLVRQAVILAGPMKPICSEACKGLCPGCGTNLNERSCSCKTGKSDPRWDDLKRLLDRSQQ